MIGARRAPSSSVLAASPLRCGVATAVRRAICTSLLAAASRPCYATIVRKTSPTLYFSPFHRSVAVQRGNASPTPAPAQHLTLCSLSVAIRLHDIHEHQRSVLVRAAAPLHRRVQGSSLTLRTQPLTYASPVVRREIRAPRDTAIYQHSLHVCCAASLPKCGAATRPTTPQPQPIHTRLASARRK